MQNSAILRPSLSYTLSLRSLFCLFLSGRFTQVLLYLKCLKNVRLLNCLLESISYKVSGILFYCYTKFFGTTGSYWILAREPNTLGYIIAQRSTSPGHTSQRKDCLFLSEK